MTELLITLGILVILSGIGLENYQSAGTRARTVRVRSDFRSIATAIEAYTTDHGSPPRMAHSRFYGDPEFDRYIGVPLSGNLSRVLSTPVAYVTNSLLFDPCMLASRNKSLDERLYTYQVLGEYKRKLPQSPFWTDAMEFYGPWRLGSVGPDRTFDHGFANSAQLPYDPTNGTLSMGNIWYAQKTGFDPLPPIPQLLGAH